jgi:hypothetical protein
MGRAAMIIRKRLELKGGEGVAEAWRVYGRKIAGLRQHGQHGGMALAGSDGYQSADSVGGMARTGNHGYRSADSAEACRGRGEISITQGRGGFWKGFARLPHGAAPGDPALGAASGYFLPILSFDRNVKKRLWFFTRLFRKLCLTREENPVHHQRTNLFVRSGISGRKRFVQEPPAPSAGSAHRPAGKGAPLPHRRGIRRCADQHGFSFS